MVPQTTMCFGEEKKFSGRLQENNGSWSSVYSETGPSGLGMCVMVASQDGPLASRDRERRGGGQVTAPSKRDWVVLIL